MPIDFASLILENGDTPNGCVPDKKVRTDLLCVVIEHFRQNSVYRKHLFGLIHKPSIDKTSNKCEASSNLIVIEIIVFVSVHSFS